MVTLSANGTEQTQEFEVFMNPNETYSKEDAEDRFALWMKIRDKYSEVSKAIIEAQELAKNTDSEELKKAAKELESSMTAVGTTLVQIANERSKLLAKIQGVSEMLISSEGPPSQGAKEAWLDYEAEIDAELAKWQAAKK
ncbi:MAG: hypothetical protein P8X60_11350 [Robiginitalea sp.]